MNINFREKIATKMDGLDEKKANIISMILGILALIFLIPYVVAPIWITIKGNIDYADIRFLFPLIFLIPFILVNYIIISILRKRKKIRYNSTLKLKIYVISILIQNSIYGIIFYVWIGDIKRLVIFIILSIAFAVVLKLLTGKLETYWNGKKEAEKALKRQKLIKHYDYCRSKNEFIDNLLLDYGDKPTDFEYYVAALLEEIGYKNVKVTAAVADGGKDIIAVKDDNIYAVEVKLYNHDNHISREKIQKLHSAMIDSAADKGIFVTTSEFSAPAKEYAEKYDIKTIDGYGLYDLYLSVPEPSAE